MTTVSVVGVGKLGAPLVACLAAKGYSVIGADTDAVKVAALNRGEAAVFEPGLGPMLKEHRAAIRGTQDIAAAVRFLASDDAAYITRQVISVNGGMV